MSRQHEFKVSDSIKLLCVSQHKKIPENSEIHTAQNCVACRTYCKFTWINVISSMIVSLHKNMWKDTVRNAAVHKIMWPTAFAVNTHEIMSSAAWLFLSTKMNDTVELKIWNTIRVCKDLNLFHHSLLKRLRLMRGPFFCYLVSLSRAKLSL